MSILSHSAFSAAALLGLLLSPHPAHSQAGGGPRQSAPPPLVTDRPDFTESIVSVAPGRVQLESGYTFSREGELKVHTLGEVLARIGVHDRAELRLGLNSYGVVDGPAGDEDGFEDFAVGVKLSLLDASPTKAPLPGVAILLATSLPTGSDGFGSDEVGPEARLALSWALGPRLSLGSNLNVASLKAESDRFAQFSGSLSLGISLAERLGGYLELFGFAAGSDSGQDASFLNGGFTLLLDPDLQLDARAGIGFDDPEPNYFVGAGLSARI